MTSKEFVLWFGGFVDAVDGIPTQAQWDTLKAKLSDVGEPITFPISSPNINPFNKPWQQPPYPYRSDINKITYDGTGNDNIALCGTAKVTNVITTEGNTSITTKIPDNATLTYTSDWLNKEK